MALLLDYTLRNGLAAPQAYLTVKGPVLSKDGGDHVLHFGLAVQATQEVEGERVPLPDEVQTQELMRCPFDLEGANPYVQAYDHLKALPAFEGAVDA